MEASYQDAYSAYRFAFESCKSYNKVDGSVSRNDFASICRRYSLNYDKFMEAIADPQGKVTLDGFVRRCQYKPYEREGGEPYNRTTSSPPPRPHSSGAGKLQRVYAGHHQSRHSVRYTPPTTAGAGGYDEDMTATDDLQSIKSRTLRQEVTRTPDFLPSPETDTRVARPPRLRPSDLDAMPPSHTDLHSRAHPTSIPRSTIDSPPHALPQPHSRKYGRSERPKSYKGDDSDNGSGNEVDPSNFFPPPEHSRSRSCKKCKYLHRQVQEFQEDLRASRTERERLEHNNERLRSDIQKAHAQNSDHAYAQLYHENERLRQENKRLRKEVDSDPDRAYLERQFEELKKARDDAEEEFHRASSSLRAYKRECSNIRLQYNNLKMKNEELQQTNWKLVDENHRVQVKLMEDQTSILARRPGDGGSEEHSGRSSLASDLAFQRSALRNTYHFGKPEASRDSHSRKMRRVPSAGATLDYDEPVKEGGKLMDDAISYSRAKSHKSAPSEASDVISFPLVTTTPDEQSQVFMVLEEDVSKSVLPEGLTEERELALMYALQNCHSVQDVIKCLVSHGCSSPGDKLQGFQVENDHLKARVEHLLARITTLSHSFDNAKANTESMYHRAQVVEANNTRLKQGFRLCQQVCDAFEVLFELRRSDPRHSGSYPNHFPSFDYPTSLESSTRSPDREQVSLKHSVVSRARSLLHSLDSNTELQKYLPDVRCQGYPSHTSNPAHWPGTLSQNTGTTSGLSSMSGGMEGEITAGEIERLRLYTQALMLYRDNLIGTLSPMDGLRGLDLLKKGEMVKDCVTTDHGGHIVDLEDAANAEELCKVREEKAELRSQIYMMEQEKRRMELEVSRMLLHKQKTDRMINEVQFLLKEEKRKRRRERKGRKPDALMAPHDPNHMSELSIEYQSALEREKELLRRYEELYKFLFMNVRASQETGEELMRFVKELRRANGALVDAFEKSKKRQQAEKKRMKQELITYMNRAQGNPGMPAIEEPTNGTIYA